MANEEILTSGQDVQSEAPAETAASSAPGLTLQDLVTVVQIIQLTSSRAAFRPEEMAAVGALYNKLVAFLESTGALTRAEQPTAPAEQPAQTEETKND